MTKQHWNPLRRVANKIFKKSSVLYSFTYQSMDTLRSAAVARASELTSQEMGYS